MNSLAKDLDRLVTDTLSNSDPNLAALDAPALHQFEPQVKPETSRNTRRVSEIDSAIVRGVADSPRAAMKKSRNLVTFLVL